MSDDLRDFGPIRKTFDRIGFATREALKAYFRFYDRLNRQTVEPNDGGYALDQKGNRYDVISVNPDMGPGQSTCLPSRNIIVFRAEAE